MPRPDFSAIASILWPAAAAEILDYAEEQTATRSPLGHGHAIDDVVGLQAALDNLTDPAELAGAIAAALAAHEAGDATDEELTLAIAAEVANRDAAIAALGATLIAEIEAKQDAATAATDAELTAATMPEPWVVVGSGGGAPAYNLDFGPSAFGLQALRFRKLPNGWVQLDGGATKATAGASGQTVFTLPEGYRPAATLRFVGSNGTTSVVFDVQTNGAVILRFAAALGAVVGLSSAWAAA